MGASVDWSREAYTLDEKRNLAVRTFFKKMYDDGLIYRGYRIVNWDPKGQTTVSDDEVIHEARKAKFYTFKYSADFPISISTTRPETKVGDTAVAVHPDDKRYTQYIGKEYSLNFAGAPLKIKIVADASVDPEFGTGALGVTPAHSQTDWEIAEKNNLEIKPVINEYARMTIEVENLHNKKTTEAREIIVAWLKANNLLEKEEEVDQNISIADRSGGIIEPLPKLQWFVDVNKEFILPQSKIEGINSGAKTTLREIMRKVIETKQIKIIPEYFDKTYFHWIENLRDWCISRQIWYGHRIPVWYKNKGENNEEIFNDINPPQGEGWSQDEDTLDTWFSSALWTFSTLGWPEETSDLKTYHPTNVLETGYEIIFFWVARMILASGYALGDIPFQTIYLNGTVRDNQGRKMSKSLGNGVDPIEIADKYGADAARMFLITSSTAGIDSRIYEDKIKGYKHFANKIWNIFRFILSNLDEKEFTLLKNNTEINLQEIDLSLKKEFHNLKKEITNELENFKFHLAAEKIYQYIWHRYADEIIEESKNIFKEEATEKIISRKKVLWEIITESMIILHPFMPYVTEEIWSIIFEDKKILMVENWSK